MIHWKMPIDARIQTVDSGTTFSSRDGKESKMHSLKICFAPFRSAP